MEERKLPHPRCTRWDMLVPWKTLNGRHTATTQCDKEEDQKSHRLATEDMRKSAGRTFQAYRRPLETVSYFKYLGWILTDSDDKWPAVVGNLQKARKIWA